MNRLFVYEEYGAKYEMMIKDLALTHRSMPQWDLYQKGLETLASSLSSRSSQADNSKKSLTISDLMVKVGTTPVHFVRTFSITPLGPLLTHRCCSPSNVFVDTRSSSRSSSSTRPCAIVQTRTRRSRTRSYASEKQPRRSTGPRTTPESRQPWRKRGYCKTVLCFRIEYVSRLHDLLAPD